MKILLTAILFLVAALFVGHLPSEGIAGMLTWFAVPETSALPIAHGIFLLAGLVWVAGVIRSRRTNTVETNGAVR